MRNLQVNRSYRQAGKENPPSFFSTSADFYEHSPKVINSAMSERSLIESNATVGQRGH